MQPASNRIGNHGQSNVPPPPPTKKEFYSDANYFCGSVKTKDDDIDI